MNPHELAERIEAEAQAAEADDAEPDNEPEPDPEPEPEAEPEPGETPEQIEKRYKEAERAANRYTSAVEKALGPLGENLAPCPLCAPFVPGFVDVNAAGHLPAEVTAAVNLFLGVVQEADYPTAAGIEGCRTCDGLGKVRTGSKVPEWRTLTCPTCSGRGYSGATAPAPNGAAYVPQPVGMIDPSAPTVEHPDVDPWGSPRLLSDGMPNPNYGKLANFKSPEYP